MSPMYNVHTPRYQQMPPMYNVPTPRYQQMEPNFNVPIASKKLYSMSHSQSHRDTIHSENVMGHCEGNSIGVKNAMAGAFHLV